jgi:hypothetical protein
LENEYTEYPNNQPEEPTPTPTVEVEQDLIKL